MKNQPPASTALPTELLVPGAASALEVNITAALLWYRGGMQDWEGLGLTTLKPLGK
jgi:hypothetical protein